MQCTVVYGETYGICMVVDGRHRQNIYTDFFTLHFIFILFVFSYSSLCQIYQIFFSLFLQIFFFFFFIQLTLLLF